MAVTISTVYDEIPLAAYFPHLLSSSIAALLGWQY
jgi:hypothetical protein